MSKLKIVKYPNKILRTNSVNIKMPIDDKMQELISDMAETMKKDNGIGLAAPQIGINQNLIVIDTSNGPLPLINPKITFFSKKTATDEEGCLSIPNINGLVPRSIKIKVTALTADKEKITFEANNLFARVLQHEIDHLNGVLFIDRITIVTRGKELLAKLKKDDVK